jgi:hypothetical protein
MANIENCFIKLNVDIATASGWLERLVRPECRIYLSPESTITFMAVSTVIDTRYAFPPSK